ncbi:MAG: maleylpyruvate isomerase family mycothiol-dependent enzyme [Nitriliruptoraceae bacterium]
MIDHVQGLREEIDRIRAVVDDLDAPVPSCPDWRVRDLLHHLGSVYRTFRRVAEEGWMERPPAPASEDRPQADDDGIVAWTDQQAELLVRALERLDPSAPRWNFSPGPQVGAFIPRRMHHESVLHRRDLEGASGRTGRIDEPVAIDGVLEYLQVYLPRSGRWEGEAGVFHTDVTDGPTFELELARDRLPVVHATPGQQPDAVVAGDAESLLLAWWDRTPLTSVLQDGDPDWVQEVRRFART